MCNLRRLICCIHQFLYVAACTVTTNHTYELFDVVAAQFKHWLAGLFVELRRAEVIGGLGDVVKLMLYQCAEFQIVALLAVIRPG
jgi:hypothetical protein